MALIDIALNPSKPELRRCGVVMLAVFGLMGRILFWKGGPLPILTPIGFTRRLVGRDTIRRELEPSETAYWMPIETTADALAYLRNS